MADLIDIDAFNNTPLTQEPFEHLIVPNFVKPEALESVQRDFPDIAKGGSYPITAVDYGPAFDNLAQELMGDELAKAFGEKFGIDLANQPTTLTVRGRTREKDGQIHTDSDTKLITVLIYLDSEWQGDGGRLRLLNSASDIEDYFTEIEPVRGKLVAFRNRDNAWHGHKQHVGERKSLQLNWVTDQAAADKVNQRHKLSAALKKLNPFA